MDGHRRRRRWWPASIVAVVVGYASLLAFDYVHKVGGRLVPSHTVVMGYFPDGSEVKALARAWWYGWARAVVPVLAFLAAIGCYHLLAVRRLPTDETRCRKCEHILCGLTQPRCPECGEPI